MPNSGALTLRVIFVVKQQKWLPAQHCSKIPAMRVSNISFTWYCFINDSYEQAIRSSQWTQSEHKHAHKRRTSVPSGGLESVIPTIELLQIYALDQKTTSFVTRHIKFVTIFCTFRTFYLRVLHRFLVRFATSKVFLSEYYRVKKQTSFYSKSTWDLCGVRFHFIQFHAKIITNSKEQCSKISFFFSSATSELLE